MHIINERLCVQILFSHILFKWDAIMIGVPDVVYHGVGRGDETEQRTKLSKKTTFNNNRIHENTSNKYAFNRILFIVLISNKFSLFGILYGVLVASCFSLLGWSNL